MRGELCSNWPENLFIFHIVRQEHQKMAQTCLVSLALIKLHQIHSKGTTPDVPRMRYKVKKRSETGNLKQKLAKIIRKLLIFHIELPKSYNFEYFTRALLKVTVLNHFHAIQTLLCQNNAQKSSKFPVFVKNSQILPL